MLLRHYLDQGTSKSALARQLGVSRDTIAAALIQSGQFKLLAFDERGQAPRHPKRGDDTVDRLIRQANVLGQPVV